MPTGNKLHEAHNLQLNEFIINKEHCNVGGTLNLLRVVLFDEAGF